MRRDHLDALGDAQARRLRVHHEGRKALGARRLAGSREHHVMVGDPGVGDPGLASVEHEMIAVAPRRHAQARHVRTALGLGKREGTDLPSLRHLPQIGGFDLGCPEERDRAAAEPLHSEGEIGETGVAREDVARDAERAHVQALGEPAVLRRHAGPKPARLAQEPHEHPASAVDVALVLLDVRAHHFFGPILEPRGEVAMPRLEEGPSEEAAVGHQLPSKTGLRFSTKAS